MDEVNKKMAREEEEELEVVPSLFLPPYKSLQWYNGDDEYSHSPSQTAALVKPSSAVTAKSLAKRQDGNSKFTALFPFFPYL